MSFLLRAAALVGVGVVVAGCDLFASSHSNSNGQTNNRPQPAPVPPQRPDFCQFLRNSVSSVRIENPRAEFNAFNRNHFTRILDNFLPSTATGDFSRINTALQPLFASLSPLGLRFYVGEDCLVSSQNEIDRLKTVFEYYTGVDSSQTRVGAPAAFNNLVNGWHNNRVAITFRDAYLNVNAVPGDDNNKTKTILTSVNVMGVYHDPLSPCINVDNPETARGILTSFETR